MTEKMQLACPHCGKARNVVVYPDVPKQRFDFTCCISQVVTSRVISRLPSIGTVREVTWEVAA
jgi:hypothetical protein